MGEHMSHADTLKGMAKAFTMVGSYEQADTCLAGADALDTVDEQAETIETLSRLLAGAEGAATELATQIDRVRKALNDITRQKAVSEYDRDHGHDNPEWHEATVDALEYAIDLFNEALKGET